MTSIVRPTTSFTAGTNFSGGTAWSVLSDQSDATALSGLNHNNYGEFADLTDPLTDYAHTLYCRASGGAGTGGTTLDLYQGNPQAGGTLILSFGIPEVAIQTNVIPLTLAQAASITNYADLWWQLTSSSGTHSIAVYDIWFEVPNRLGPTPERYEDGTTSDTAVVTGPPAVELFSQDTNTTTSPWTVDMPTGIQVGELLLAFVSSSQSDATPIVPAAGWTLLGDSTGSGFADWLGVFYKWADGTEGSSQSWTGGFRAAAQIYRIKRAHPTLPPDLKFAFDTTGGTTVPDSPYLSPVYGTRNYLWFSVIGCANTTQPTASPAGYTTMQLSSAGGGTTSQNTVLAVAYKGSTGVANENPGPWTGTCQWAAFTVAVPPLGVTGSFPQVSDSGVATDMAVVKSAPFVLTEQSDTNGAAASPWPVSMPSGIQVGDLLVAFVATSGNTNVVATPAGWTLLGTPETGHLDWLAVFYKWADGTEGSSQQWTGGFRASADIYRIGRANAFLAPVISAAAFTTGSTAPDTPSLTPGYGVQDYLWFTVVGSANETNPTASPSGYSTKVYTPATGGSAGASAILNVAYKAGAAAASEDPGVWTGLATWAGFTVAILPTGVTGFPTVNESVVASDTAQINKLVVESGTASDVSSLSKIVPATESGLATDLALVEAGPTIIITSDTIGVHGTWSGRQLDYMQNGNLWLVLKEDTGGSTDNLLFYRSTDGGQSWQEDVSSRLTDHHPSFNPVMFIDKDDYAHLLYHGVGSGVYFLYRRGTPSADRKSYSWSASTSIVWFGYGDDSIGTDIVAHREGTGWKAHMIFNQVDVNGFIQKLYQRLNITSGGVITSDTQLQLHSIGASPNLASAMDFRHEANDSKAVQAGTPSVYITWYDISNVYDNTLRYVKLTYSGGSWSQGSTRTIVSGGGQGARTLGLVYDGARVMICHALSGTDTVPRVYERDEADTTTTVRLPTALSDGTVLNQSIAVVPNGDIWLVAQGGTSDLWKKIKFDRAALTWGSWQMFASGPGGGDEFTLMRGMAPYGLGMAYNNGTATPDQTLYAVIVQSGNLVKVVFDIAVATEVLSRNIPVSDPAIGTDVGARSPPMSGEYDEFFIYDSTATYDGSDAVLVSAADSAVGTDTSKKGMAVSDSAVGSDTSSLTQSVLKTASDSGVGTDTADSVDIGIFATDSGTSAELAKQSIDKPAVDSGVATDVAPKLGKTVEIDGHVNDNAFLTAALVRSDSGTASDTTTASTPTSKFVVDTGVSAEIAEPTLYATGADSGVGTDSSVVTLPKVAVDSAVATDVGALAPVSVAVTDTATSTEFALGPNMRFVTDSGVGVESPASRLVNLYLTDSGVAAESTTLAVPGGFFATDSAVAVDRAQQWGPIILVPVMQRLGEFGIAQQSGYSVPAAMAAYSMPLGMPEGSGVPEPVVQWTYHNPARGAVALQEVRRELVPWLADFTIPGFIRPMPILVQGLLSTDAVAGNLHTLTPGTSDIWFTFYSRRPGLAYERYTDGLIEGLRFDFTSGMPLQVGIQAQGREPEFLASAFTTNVLEDIRAGWLTYIGATIKFDWQASPATTLRSECESGQLYISRPLNVFGNYRGMKSVGISRGNLAIELTVQLTFQNIDHYRYSVYGGLTATPQGATVYGSAEMTFWEWKTPGTGRYMKVTLPAVQWDVAPPQPLGSPESGHVLVDAVGQAIVPASIGRSGHAITVAVNT